MNAPTPARDAAIDSLRGIAITLVLLLHFALAFGVSDSLIGDLLGRPFTGALVRSGNYGVTVFFVVSGFLITSGLLARHGELSRLNLKQFYVARAGRILPPLLLALAIIVPLGLAGVPYFDNSDGDVVRPASFWWPAVGSVLTFWHNQLMQSAGYFNYCLNVYWSLSVEEVFYLVFPLLCLLLRREALIAAACLLLVALGPMFRAQHSDNEVAYLYAYPACFDAIAFGCLCALACRRWMLPAGWAKVLAPLAAVAMVVVYFIGFANHPVFGFSAMALSAAVFIWATRRPATTFGGGLRRALVRATTPLRWLGRHSYELYLFHVIVLAGMRQFFSRESLHHDQRAPLLLAFVLSSALLAALISRHFAEPINRRWRLRWQA
ncbi:MAG TPA: acyltransferase [Ideonella sp.]|uniref:acyltransferase family protein n=1 Tax=Ideonella sp. TaxID=1929293 RepID=UPI002E36AFE8|nr:acyltransferase [Ideonella sp.]HEX5684067.1 acyltransferase [Ideonella sp.]